MPVPSKNSFDHREQRYAEFVSLLARHDLSIRRFVRFLLPTAEGVEDIVQDTALECWRKFEDFQPQNHDVAQDEFIRWACVIARFKVMAWQRDRQRDRLVFKESVVERLAATVVDDAFLSEQRLALESCLSSLSDDEKNLVLSVHSPGQSVAAIAGQTGQSARRLYSRLNALRRQLISCVQQKITTEVQHG